MTVGLMEYIMAMKNAFFAKVGASTATRQATIVDDPSIDKLQQELSTAENKFNKTKSTHT